MKPSSTSVVVATVVLASFGCSSSAGDSGGYTVPVVPCEGTGTCGASGGAGSVPNSGGAFAAGGSLPAGGTPGSGGALVAGGSFSTGGLPASGGMPASGGAANTGGAPPVPEEECDVPIEIRARRDVTGAKFPVSEGTIDLYQCFSFKVDLPQKVQGISFKPLIDKSDVVHHYILYKMLVPQADGVTSPCVGLHRDGVFLDGWAPGQTGVTLPKEVGMDLGTGDFMLEIHYNNLGESTEDSSGLRICATEKLRPNTSTVSFLGTEAIAIPPAAKGFQVTSRCTPAYTAGPIHIVRSWPHMHLLGRNMKADIVRANGTTEVLFDKKFAFGDQRGYETPAVINPGDAIVTTCTWDNEGAFPVTFGEGTAAEMCYNFTVAYPAHALQSLGIHSTSCTL